MKLERLRITHLPGMNQGVNLEDLDPGLNIITGPNASGKSSIVRALHYLVDSHSEPDQGALTLEAVFQVDSERVEVTRTGSQVVWQKHGQPMEPPALPETEFVHCYWLSMADLLEQGPTEAAILDQLRRELAGGFDLDAVRRDPMLSVGPQHGRRQEQVLRERDKALRAIRQQYESLERQREELPALEEQIRGAERANQEAASIEQAMALLEAMRQRSEAETLLGRFPEAMGWVNGDEARRLQSLEEQLETLRNDHSVAEQARSRASQAMVDTGLADNAPAEEDLEACREHLEQAGQCAARLTEQQGTLDRARAREQQAVANLHPTADDQPSLEPKAVARATRLAEQLREKRRRLEELQSEAGVEPPDETVIEAQRTMARELARWLRQLEPARFRHLLVGAGTAVAAALAATVSGFLEGAFVTLALALVAALGGGWSLWQLRGMGGERRLARQRALEHELAPPDAWEPAAVAERLKSLETAIAEGQLQVERARLDEARQSDLASLRDSVSALEDEKADLAREVGFDPEVTAEGVAWFMNQASELVQARAQRAEVQNRMEGLQEEMERHLQQVVTVLGRHGAHVEAAADIATVKSHFQALESRVMRLRESEKEHARARDEVARLGRQIDEARQALEDLYRGAGLEPGDRQSLIDYCNQLPQYRQARDEVRKAQVLEQDRRSRIEADAQLLELATSGEDTELQRRLTDARERASELETLRDRRSELRAQLDETGRNRDLERARLAAEQARDALTDAWHEAMVAEAGQFLLCDVAEEHRTEHQPAVLADARRRLARFTHNRYDLEVGENGRIEVRDTVQGLRQPPDHLSTGTRMQLFLAVRLAWTSVQEGGRESLPIFLDEALTTSDPERFDAIVHNLQSLVNDEGRQVIYLSAEPADVVRWERALGGPVHSLDLLAGQRVERRPEGEQYPLAPVEPVPEPGARAPEDYAALLGVPPVEPVSDAGAIHVFHLLRDDLPMMHQLMERWRTCRLGELELLLDSNAGMHALTDGEQLNRLRARCRIARLWVELWVVGRGRRVDRNALEASGAVTESFIDAVTEQAGAVNGDAGALIQALRDRKVARFQQTKADELEEWFRDNGYIVDEAPLTPEQREQQTLWRAGDLAPPEEIQAVVSWLEAGLVT